MDLDITPHEHWKWKFLDNPLKKSFITVCEHDKKIVACEHEFLIKSWVGKSKLLCTYSSDQAVHPDYRGMGLSKAMVEYSSEKRRKYGCGFSYWITSNPIMIRSYTKHWPSFPHRVINLVKIQDIGLQLHKMPMKNPWFMRVGYLFLKYVNKIKNLLNNYDSHNELAISKVDAFDDRVNMFWAKIQHNHDFIVERTKEYLNWRYCDPRAGPYVIRVAQSNNEIIGYSVLRINRYRQDYQVGYIMDVLALPERLDAVDKLIADATEFFKTQEINICNCFIVKGHPYEPIYKKHGFLDSRIRTHIFLNLLGEIDEEIGILQNATPDRIHFSYGDIDSLPVESPNQ
jgi:GNAT superfamily N-acetyltransferase